MARALSRLATDRTNSLATLARCHRIFASDGSLADFFFPALRKADCTPEARKAYRAELQKDQAAQAGIASLTGESLDGIRITSPVYQPDPALLERLLGPNRQ